MEEKEIAKKNVIMEGGERERERERHIFFGLEIGMECIK